MTKKEEKEYKSLIKDLEREFGSHAYILEHGTNDPFWEDGANLWLTRNHIIYGKKKIREICDENEMQVPDIVNRPTPKEVPKDYMAPDSKACRHSANKIMRKETQKNGQIKLVL